MLVVLHVGCRFSFREMKTVFYFCLLCNVQCVKYSLWSVKQGVHGS